LLSGADHVFYLRDPETEEGRKLGGCSAGSWSSSMRSE
jgi:hypothetical protein